MNSNITLALSTASSSSMDTDEEIEQNVSIFLGYVEEAANLLYESTSSSSRRKPRAANIERNRVAANERLMWDYFGFCRTTLAFAGLLWVLRDYFGLCGTTLAFAGLLWLLRDYFGLCGTTLTHLDGGSG